jgi:hypothetical protein
MALAEPERRLKSRSSVSGAGWFNGLAGESMVSGGWNLKEGAFI